MLYGTLIEVYVVFVEWGWFFIGVVKFFGYCFLNVFVMITLCVCGDIFGV